MQDHVLELDERIIVIASAAGIDNQKVIKFIEEVSEAAKKIFITFAELLAPAYDALKKLAEDFKELEFEPEYKREIYRLDFKRPKIQHQVLNRKPRNLIKKII